MQALWESLLAPILSNFFKIAFGQMDKQCCQLGEVVARFGDFLHLLGNFI